MEDRDVDGESNEVVVVDACKKGPDRLYEKQSRKEREDEIAVRPEAKPLYSSLGMDPTIEKTFRGCLREHHAVSWLAISARSSLDRPKAIYTGGEEP